MKDRGCGVLPCRTTPAGMSSVTVRVLRCLLIIAVLTVFLSCGLFSDGRTGATAPIHRLVVLHTNDTHGHPLKFYNYSVPNVGGLPARAMAVHKIRAEEKNVLVLDAGDINTGRAESNFFTARPDIEGFNYIGYDAMVLGNHEFDHSVAVLKQQMAWANFPFLSANVKTAAGDDLAQPYIIKEFDGFKVAILGLTTQETLRAANPANTKGLTFEDEVAVARRFVPQLRAQADIVIALVHMGIYPSNSRGSKRLAAEVPGIDLIVDGHTHTKLEAPILVRATGSERDTVIVQAWKWGLVMGRVDLGIQDGRMVDYRFSTIPINLKTVETSPDGKKTYRFIGEPIAEDPSLLALLQPYAKKAEAELSEKIGYSEQPLLNHDVRRAETALGNLVADAMVWYTKDMGADFAILNGGSVRSSLSAGSITKQDIYNILPFDTAVMVVTLRGADLRALFDFIATINPGDGAFPQVSKGLSFTIDRPSRRCTDIRVGGRPIDPAGHYKIATNTFLAAGGDGYKIFRKARDVYDTSVFMRDALIRYITATGGSVEAETENRIRIIGGMADLWYEQAA